MPLKLAKLEVILFFIGATLIAWWCSIEYQWVIPRPLPLTKPPLSFKTGDLLFFRGLSWIEKTIQAYTRCRYNHVSMVVEELGRYFLWEADVGEGYRKGPRMIPLELKLQRWRGTSEIAYRPIKKELVLDSLLKVANRKVSGEFDKSMMKWLTDWWPREGEKYFCSELVVATLQALGLLGTQRRASSYSPKDLAFGHLDSHVNKLSLISK